MQPNFQSTNNQKLIARRSVNGKGNGPVACRKYLKVQFCGLSSTLGCEKELASTLALNHDFGTILAETKAIRKSESESAQHFNQLTANSQQSSNVPGARCLRSIANRVRSSPPSKLATFMSMTKADFHSPTMDYTIAP